MSIENRIALVKDLIRKREEIDQRLSELFGGQLPKKQKRAAHGAAIDAGRAPAQKPATEGKREQEGTGSPWPFETLSRAVADESGDVL